MTDLPVFFQKINRADQHVTDLNDVAERFFSEARGVLYRLHSEAHSKGAKHRFLFRAELLQPLPLVEWGIRVGDAVHCLRSALDQLVYSLSSRPDGNTAFPIFRTEKDWFTKAPAMLWSVPDPVVAAINLHQPYHRGNAAHTHPLAVLSALSNADKHRYIAVVALNLESFEWGITHTQGVSKLGDLKIKPGAALETDAVVAEMPFTPDGSGLDPEVQMNGDIRFRIAFGRTDVPSSLAGQPLTPAYNKVGEAVVDVIEEIRKAVGGSVFLPLQKE